LKFIKFADEEYDFLIRKEVLWAHEGRKFLEALNSEEFTSRLPSGLWKYERTGEVIFFDERAFV